MFRLDLVLHDLVEPFTIDVGFDLHPHWQMVRELKAEFLAGIVLIRERAQRGRARKGVGRKGVAKGSRLDITHFS